MDELKSDSKENNLIPVDQIIEEHPLFHTMQELMNVGPKKELEIKEQWNYNN